VETTTGYHIDQPPSSPHTLPHSLWVFLFGFFVCLFVLYCLNTITNKFVIVFKFGFEFRISHLLGKCIVCSSDRIWSFCPGQVRTMILASLPCPALSFRVFNHINHIHLWVSLFWGTSYIFIASVNGSFFHFLNSYWWYIGKLLRCLGWSLHFLSSHISEFSYGCQLNFIWFSWAFWFFHHFTYK
jgi:hypothetical protein